MTPAPGTPAGRRAGLLIPLFSFPSRDSWGIGEIADIPAMTAWLAAAGVRILQMLPLNEMASGQQSPYSAISAMAVDPIFIRVPDVPEFAAAGGEQGLSADDRAELAAVRTAPRVEHHRIRRLKTAALTAAFGRFFEDEWRRDTARGRELRAFVDEQAWWLDDYSVFRAIRAREHNRPWTEWPADLQTRDPGALARVRQELARDVLFYQYLQWLAASAWQRARTRANGVALFGDLPFMVDGDSADVWARQHEFRFDATIGAPPDAFSSTGQDWGLPLYDWKAIAAGGYEWLRARARRSADVFGGYRVDHLVGFYRTYGRPKDGSEAFFTPPDEAAQTALGETVLGVFRAAGAEIIAEDLGTVPDFVRESLERLAVPGFRVLRWERFWKIDGQPFRDPSEYPPISVATSGTHDTEPLATWWDTASEDERAKISSLPTIARMASEVGAGPAEAGRCTDFEEAARNGLVHADYCSTVRDVLLEALFASGSDLLILPVQDVFGWRDRINEPAKIDEQNWTFRLPWPVDALDEIPEARERQARLREWAGKYSRLSMLRRAAAR